MCTHVDHSVMV